jgi:hypothetical protein
LNLSNNIIKEIKTIEDIFKKLGKKHSDIVPWKTPKNKAQKSQNAFALIQAITEVYNEGHEFNWSNDYKYYPWLKKMLLVAGLSTNQIKMEANKAREISEKIDNYLKALLFSIKANAEQGRINVTWSKKDRVITENELNELRKLGYTIIKNGVEYVSVGW